MDNLEGGGSDKVDNLLVWNLGLFDFFFGHFNAYLLVFSLHKPNQCQYRLKHKCYFILKHILKVSWHSGWVWVPGAWPKCQLSSVLAGCWVRKHQSLSAWELRSQYLSYKCKYNWDSFVKKLNMAKGLKCHRKNAFIMVLKKRKSQYIVTWFFLLTSSLNHWYI